MATRRNQQAKLANNVAVSGTSTYTSNWFDVSVANTVGAMVTMTGTMTGTLTVEVSYEPVDTAAPSQITPVNFSAVSFLVNNATVANIAVAAAGVFVIESGITSATWFRVKYVNATNSGTFSVNAVAKAFH